MIINLQTVFLSTDLPRMLFYLLWSLPSNTLRFSDLICILPRIYLKGNVFVKPREKQTFLLLNRKGNVKSDLCFVKLFLCWAHWALPAIAILLGSLLHTGVDVSFPLKKSFCDYTRDLKREIVMHSCHVLVLEAVVIQMFANYSLRFHLI